MVSRTGHPPRLVYLSLFFIFIRTYLIITSFMTKKEGQDYRTAFIFSWAWHDGKTKTGSWNNL